MEEENSWKGERVRRRMEKSEGAVVGSVFRKYGHQGEEDFFFFFLRGNNWSWLALSCGLCLPGLHGL